ncbi:MAG: PAS domain S-box protein [Longimicrobiales bacterium]
MSDEVSRQPYSLPRLTELYTMLGEMLPDVPAIVYRCRHNRAWTMLDLAEPVRALTGYGPEELIDDAVVTYGELIHEEDRDRVWDEVQRALDAELSFRTTYRIRTRDGAVRRVWEQGRRVVRPTGSEEIIGFIQDVTDWQEEWDRLEESARLLQQTVAGLEEAVLVIDTSGEGRGVLSVNPAAERIFGYTAEELVGSTTEKLHVSRERFEAFSRELDPVLEREGVVRAGYTMRRKDGSEFAAEQTVSLLDPERGITGGAVSVIRDVSERQTLREQLQQSQRLEAVGRLAGGVAHDFNNLLTVIWAHSDFAVMDLDESDPLLDELRAIQNAADRAADLTAQLLAFSREQVLRPRVVDMNEIVVRVERLLDRVIGEPIAVRTELHPEPLPVKLDPVQLEQAMVNLAVNARDAMPDGGTLTLGTALVRSQPDDEATMGSDDADLGTGPHVRLTVTDTGVGMDAETQTRIFDPFFTTKEKGQGTGLGLATTYGFVSQSGGTIEVESAPNEGTRFILRFPLAAGTPEAAETAEKSAVRPLGGATILVVEDEANVLRVIEKTLTRAGCTVRTAGTGEEGLEILEREHGEIDLVLTDLVLPGISGQALVDRALSLDPPLPVIIMSGYAAGSPGRTADIPPEAGFIEKPFTPASLVDRVRETLADR